jgi:hypothetical protein
MTLKKIKNMTKTAIFESKLLLFVAAINYRAEEIVSLLSLDDIIEYLSIVEPCEISNR